MLALRNKRPSRRLFRLTALETLRAWELAGAYNLGPATSILTLPMCWRLTDRFIFRSL